MLLSSWMNTGALGSDTAAIYTRLQKRKRGVNLLSTLAASKPNNVVANESTEVVSSWETTTTTRSAAPVLAPIVPQTSRRSTRPVFESKGSRRLVSKQRISGPASMHEQWPPLRLATAQSEFGGVSCMAISRRSQGTATH